MLHSPITKSVAGTGIALCLLPAVAFAQGARLYQHKSEAPVKGRENVSTVTRLARLTNDRALYQLTQSANEGAPVRFSTDKQVEEIRRPYQPYRPAPLAAEGGFTSLGLGAANSWNDQGFFNLYINDVGFNYTAPEMTSAQTPAQSLVRYVWTNSQARLTQTFVLRARDEKLLMKLEVTPNPGVKIERLALQLRNDWHRANTAYSNPSVLNGAIVTAQGESVPPRRVGLKAGEGNWVAYLNKGLGIGPSGLLFVPAEVQSGHVLADENKSVTTLFLAPGRRAFHFALWDVPKQRDEAFVAYLKAASTELGESLGKLAAADWNAPLPPVEATARLHLTDEIYAAKAEEKTQGFIAYASHPLRYVDANSLPTGRAPQLTLQAAPGQNEQAAFALYALRNVGRVTVEPGVLTGPGGATIAAGNIDTRIVKVWAQQIGVWGGSDGDFALTPELLVRNDTLSLDKAWTGPGSFHPEGKVQTGYISGPTVTDIPRDTSRQVWMMVKVPDDAAPGIYRGGVTVKAEKGGTIRIPMSVNVFPITLAQPDDRYVLSIYYRGKPVLEGEKPPKYLGSDNVSPELFRRQLQDIKDHGFNSLYLAPPSVEKFKTAMLPVYYQVGFTGPVTIAGWGNAYTATFDEKTNEAHKARIREYLSLFEGKTAPNFYGIDEPHGDRIALNIKRADITRSVEAAGLRGQYASAGNGEASAAQVGHLDYPIISSYFSSRDQMLELRDKYVATGAKPLYYWQIWGEYPQGSRVNAGFFFYASGYKGLMPYVYQHFVADPYNEDQERINIDGSSLKNMIVSYPANEGSITTLQWEAARAGIWDLRYLITLDQAIQKASGRVSAEELNDARATLKEMLDKYGYQGSKNWGRMIYGAINWPDHQTTVAPETFDRDRRAIAELILKLKT